ncbi:MAG: DNA-binding domain-containing protein, partial [Betaproteobacteria bacterium]|nr:DNA-binding domain-containing protein [Betaproteobacteria bacterium]
MTLGALQAGLQAYILDEADDPGRVLALLEGGFGIPRERRAAIYRNAYRARLKEALQYVFERTWAYVGDDDFATACARYVESHP